MCVALRWSEITEERLSRRVMLPSSVAVFYQQYEYIDRLRVNRYADACLFAATSERLSALVSLQEVHVRGARGSARVLCCVCVRAR